MFRKLGYHDDYRNLRDDEAEWFKAIESAIASARKAEPKMPVVLKRGGKNG